MNSPSSVRILTASKSPSLKITARAAVRTPEELLLDGRDEADTTTHYPESPDSEAGKREQKPTGLTA